jgi:choice-of-anchor B domain-containing protein
MAIPQKLLICSLVLRILKYKFMRKYLLSFAIALTLIPSVWGQASKNMNLLGQLSFPDDCADVMGYVAPGGTEYALIGHESGVGIVSLANPTNPVLLQDLPGVSTIWREIDVYQNFAYIVNEGGDGLRIVNLANLPGAVTYKDTIIAGMNTGHTLFIEGSRLYVFGADIDQGGVSIFSLANPWKPVKIGAWTQLYVHDAYVRNGIAFLSHINDGFMQIVDLSILGGPVTLGSVVTPSSFTHNTWLNDAGTVVFTTDEVNAAYIAAYDITTPSNITEVARYRSSLSTGQAIPHNVKVLNDYQINAYYKDGVNIADASRPHNIVEVGYYDTNPLSGNGFDGVWGLDCYLPSGNIIASDISEGLFILGPTYVRGCYLEGIVTDLNTGLPINGANVVIQTTPASDMSDPNGNYATGVADAGTYTVTYSKFGYRDSTISVALNNGVLVTTNMPLKPLNRVSMTINVIEAGTGNPIPNAKLLLTETQALAQTPYTANGSGQVADPNFIAGTYSIVAGNWGWVTQEVIINLNLPVNVVTVTLPVGYYDDFALNLGWISAGNASSGLWERGEPIGTFGGFGNQEYNPENDIAGDILDQCYVTGNGGGAIGDDDVDAGSTTLRSPVMDLTTYNAPMVRFYRWFANGGGNGGPNDTLRIELRNGNQTAIIKRVYGIFSNQWVQDTFVVSNYLPITNNMDIRFIATDTPQGHVVEAAVDGFDVVEHVTVGTANPFQNSGELTIFPNPVTPSSVVRYHLGGDQDTGTFELHDLLGKLVYAQPLSQTEGQFQLKADLATGAYMASIKIDGKTTKVVKVMR